MSDADDTLPLSVAGFEKIHATLHCQYREPKATQSELWFDAIMQQFGELRREVREVLNLQKRSLELQSKRSRKAIPGGRRAKDRRKRA
jgi:hypothetical protein